MCHLPDGYREVEHAEARHGAAHPAGGDGQLEAVKPCLARGEEEKIVIAPIAQPERMRPGQERQHDAYLQAQDNVKDD